MADTYEAFKKLTEAKEAFFREIKAFEGKVSLDTIGLNEWIDDIDDVMCDIESEMFDEIITTGH